jgi:hypothetical protein
MPDKKHITIEHTSKIVDKPTIEIEHISVDSTPEPFTIQRATSAAEDEPSDTVELTTSEERVTMNQEMRPLALNSEEAGLLAAAANGQAATVRNMAQGYTKDSPTERTLIGKANKLTALADRLSRFSLAAPPTVQQLDS